MAITKIKISFVSVAVNDAADIWGYGMWSFSGTIDGKQVGTVNQPVMVLDKDVVKLGEEWSAEVDVSGKTQLTDSVKATFSVMDIELGTNDALGDVSYEFKYPFTLNKTISLWAGGKYTVIVKMKVVQYEAMHAQTKWEKGVKVSRQRDGSTTFTTISGYQLLPRIEVCPVVPSPQPPSSLPPRPDYAANLGLIPGKNTPQNSVVSLWPIPHFNSTYNPSLIPILSNSDPAYKRKIAKLAVTYVEPGDVDLSKLVWTVKSGPAQIVGSAKGAEIQVIGTGSGDTDLMAEFEVRWADEKGPLLATYRAWVGKVKTAMYRINLINGPDLANPGDQSVAFLPDDYKKQIEMARVLFWQAGIRLIPDTDITCWDGATTKDPATGDPLPSGVFIVPVTDATLTVNVNNFAVTPASRLNCRIGVLHLVIVCTTQTGRAAATDIQDVDGKPYQLGGTPSASWVLPSGVPPDDAAGALSMKTFAPSNRVNKKAAGDDAYVVARHKVDPGFTAASMGHIYAAVFPSNWTTVQGSGVDPNAAVNVSHEMGHVLGLMHRGHTNQAARGPYGSDDLIDCKGTDGKIRGHPWHENIMTYGYAGNTGNVPRAQDFDLLQTAVMRKHPSLKS